MRRVYSAEIETRVVDVSSIVAGEFHENEIRKNFTPSKRVAVVESIKEERGERGGGRTDLPANAGKLTGETDDHAAQMSGFGSADMLEAAVIEAEASCQKSRRLMFAFPVHRLDREDGAA